MGWLGSRPPRRRGSGPSQRIRQAQRFSRQRQPRQMQTAVSISPLITSAAFQCLQAFLKSNGPATCFLQGNAHRLRNMEKKCDCMTSQACCLLLHRRKASSLHPQVRSHLRRSQMRLPAQRRSKHKSLGRARAETPGARSTSASCAAWACLGASRWAARATRAARWSCRGRQHLPLKLLSLSGMEARWQPKGGKLSLT